MFLAEKNWRYIQSEAHFGINNNPHWQGRQAVIDFEMNCCLYQEKINKYLMVKK